MKAILLVLLLLYGVDTLELSTQHPLVTPNNASETFLVCPPAENFIQTHMAPDFETPQLVRRLDWFHDDSLIASYQQNLIDDVSRQWWVADGRYQLIRPFYYLRIAPVQPEDSGTYRCRLETDPLFALTMSTAQVELTVMVRPVAPSSPEIKSSSNRSVTLVWNHNTAEAHRPILRFSVVVRSVIDEEQFIIPAPSNATSVIVDNLSPFTLYTFAVRAENAAGYSEFGPETKFRTLGEAPMNPPHIISIVNTTSSCVSVLVEPPEEMQGDLNGYTVVLQRLNDTEPRREFFPGTPSGRLSLCHLVPHSSYAIAIEVDNGFGPSPPARTIFITDETVPEWAPSNIRIVPSVGKASLTVHWNTPNISNEIITHYNLYYKAHGQNKWKMSLLNDRKKNQITHKYELKGLAHSTTYSIRISASTSKGEGEGSKTQNATTDIAVPVPTEISNITFDCKDGVHLHWHSHHSERAHYHVEMKNRTRKLLFNTTINKLDVVDLSHYEEYAVRVSCSIRSLVDQSILNGPWGEEQRFMLNDQCSYQSSLCSPNSKCLRLVQSSGPLRLPYLVAILALILFIILCFIVAYSLKGHCLDMKMLLKKKKEKCVYLEELSPLVYDSTACDDIPVELFYGYCEDLSRNENCKYRLQFEQIERITSGDSAEADMLEKNLDKNRYLNIGAMEATRIRISSSAGSDYINANYIDSCEKRNAYIATQAPLPSTFADFWAMIWQERCNVVVVITNMVEDGRRKCDQYWPSCIQSPQTHGTYQVGLVAETTNAHFIHRILSLRIAKCVPPMERRVHQLHFTGWPDHGVPDTVFPLLTFMNFVSDIHSTGPIVVHCSAGVGRSGSYILVDSMRRHLINFRRLNVMGHLIHMRRQRQKLVQTLEQYILCHEAIRQLIRHGITRVHSNLFHRYLHYLAEENVNGKTRMQMQYEDLCECKHNPRCVPPNDYIVLPGYHRQDEFIVSNWPTENEEFWQLVWQKNCQTVVLLAEDAYWTGLEQVGEMVIQHGENFALLQNNEDQLCVRIVPVSRTAIEADFWGEIERIQKERLAYHDAPLLVINTGSWLMTPCTNQRMSSTIVHPSVLNETRNSTLSLSLAYNDVPPSLAYALCALTALACQLEQQGCVDVVQVLSSYSHLHCGLWASKQDIEFIYSKLAVLVGSSRV